MIVVKSSNQTFRFESRETNETNFTLLYIKEGTQESNTLNASGSYQHGQVVINANINLSVSSYYLFLVKDSSGDELCRHRVFCTDQDIDQFSVDNNTYVEADSFVNEYITI